MSNEETVAYGSFVEANFPSGYGNLNLPVLDEVAFYRTY